MPFNCSHPCMIRVHTLECLAMKCDVQSVYVWRVLVEPSDLPGLNETYEQLLKAAYQYVVYTYMTSLL